MLSAHATVAYLAVAVPALAAAVGGFVYWRRRGAGRFVANLLALAQTLLVAQVGLVLGGRRGGRLTDAGRRPVGAEGVAQFLSQPRETGFSRAAEPCDQSACDAVCTLVR